MNERNSDNWEKGFDLNALPDVELLDAQEPEPAPAAPPVSADAEQDVSEPPPPAEERDLAAEDEADEAEEPDHEPAAQPERLPEREVDPLEDPFAGWLGGHPVAAGEQRMPGGVTTSALVPEFEIVAAGEDPFAGRFAEEEGEETREEAAVAEGAEDEAQVAEAEPAAEESAQTVVAEEADAAEEEARDAVMVASAGGSGAVQLSNAMVQGALQARKSAASAPAAEATQPGPLAEVVSITSGRAESDSDAGTGGGDDDVSGETSAMQIFLAGLSDEELDQAVELFEEQVRNGRAIDDDDDAIPGDLLDPLSDVLASKNGQVEATYRIEEIEDIIDARLPDAARDDSGWWTNQANDPGNAYARAWVDAGWWSYPDLDAGRVRFRRPV